MQMDEMTQQNAALVEEAASASESMEEQAKGMMQLMEFFNVGDAGGSANYSATPARTPAPVARSTRPAQASAPKPRAPDANDSEWDEF